MAAPTPVQDAELCGMRRELTEFGLDEDNLTKEEMSDLLEALRSSKNSATEEELQRTKSEETCPELAPDSHILIRRYVTVVDRRLPWCLLPPNLTPAQKVKCLSAYIKLLSINQYMKARNSLNFEAWAPAVQIASDTATRTQPPRATRSGRSAPSYADIDDDIAEVGDFTVKRKKRKVSNSEATTNNEVGIYSNKTFSLKRKSQKADINKPEKEIKLEDNCEVSICDVEIQEDTVDAGLPSNVNSFKCMPICNSSSRGSSTKEISQTSSKLKQRKNSNKSP